MENIQTCNAFDSTAQHKYGSTILSLLLTDFVIVDQSHVFDSWIGVLSSESASKVRKLLLMIAGMDITQSCPGRGYHLLMRIS